MDKGLADLEKLSEYLPSLGNIPEHHDFLRRERARGRRMWYSGSLLPMARASHSHRQRPLPADGELSSTRTSFSLKFNTIVWVLTAGLQFFVGWWYRKSAVFYLPPGWFGPLTWVLAFPFAPSGSVSCGVWQMACRRVIKVGERVVKDLASRPGEHSAALRIHESVRCADDRPGPLPGN